MLLKKKKKDLVAIKICLSLCLDPRCGGIPQGESNFRYHVWAEEVEIGQEIKKANWDLDRNGLFCHWKPRRAHFHCLFSGIIISVVWMLVEKLCHRFYYTTLIVLLLFSQMLMVSSTEPCTLANCDPPQVHRPPTVNLVGRTVPPRPIPHAPVQGRALSLLMSSKCRKRKEQNHNKLWLLG